MSDCRKSIFVTKNTRKCCKIDTVIYELSDKTRKLKRAINAIGF